ncbi:heavy-metal-associated domain-containing protein [Streptomyces naphthomycinicus]|uniref:heavy-metal-associated domain-containing protein n=1 Tax=Streptomyces naphthomycinicus TaxID=2872625 RepID=UPI001CED5057|nr:heavy-metal-associated domain-containing protein [Streptomyces sp. TML10]
MSSCCAPDGSCHSGAATEVAVAGTAIVYAVSGMTCDHCKSAVTEAVGGVDGVLSTDVDVDAGRVTVIAEGGLDDALIAKAVDEAGYELTGRAS